MYRRNSGSSGGGGGGQKMGGGGGGGGGGGHKMSGMVGPGERTGANCVGWEGGSQHWL